MSSIICTVFIVCFYHQNKRCYQTLLITKPCDIMFFFFKQFRLIPDRLHVSDRFELIPLCSERVLIIKKSMKNALEYFITRHN